MEVSRCYFRSIDNIVCRQIHGFSNASKNGYAAVVYLRTEYESGVVDIRLVASRTKVSPIKGQSIPRLELMAALLLSKLVYTTILALKSYPFGTGIITSIRSHEERLQNHNDPYGIFLPRKLVIF